jgi:hypothetical protein
VQGKWLWGWNGSVGRESVGTGGKEKSKEPQWLKLIGPEQTHKRKKEKEDGLECLGLEPR